jgi:tight adherence protein B
MNSDYIGTLFSHPIGQAMLIAGAAGQVIGFLFIRKITTIEV